MSTCQCLVEENPCCGVCYSKKDIRILPAKKDGHFIGQFFLCAKCAKGLVSLELELAGAPSITPIIAA